MRLVLASNNPGKLSELRSLLGPLGIELVGQGELGVDEAAEPHATFVENALAKARHAARRAGAAAIADDSGLVVDALGGSPGVDSAHYAPVQRRVTGREAHRLVQDRANNAQLVERMQGVAERRARFVCTLVALRSAEDPEPLIATGRWAAELLESARGEGGFGYDPLVWIPALGASVAELDATKKNELSHRAQAARQMVELLRVHWALA